MEVFLAIPGGNERVGAEAKLNNLLGVREGDLSEFLLRLQKLKEIDETIDLSRSTMQFEVLLFIGANERTSIDELSQGLSFRRKALNDTLRKLVNKDLVSKTDDGYFVLTKKGTNYLKELAKIVGGAEGDFFQLMKAKDSVEDARREALRTLIKELATSLYIYNVLICLGTSKNYELPLSTLARIVGLSEVRLKSYLDLFVNTPSKDLRLFVSYEKPTRLSEIIAKLRGTKPKRKTYYRLSNQGISVFYRLPFYMKVKRNPFLRVLKVITRTSHPEVTIRRLCYVVMLGNIYSFIALLFPPYGYFVAAAWLFALIILYGITLLSNL